MAGDEMAPPAKRLKSSNLPPPLRDAKRKDIDSWETNRMLTSGVAQRRYDEEFVPDDEEGTRVHLLVHDLRPPFLDGRTIFTKQLEPISAVRDPQSDMAVLDRKSVV